MAPLQQLPVHAQMSQLVKEQQQRFVSRLEELDGTKFKVEPWEESGKGHGISCIIEDGNIFERGAVNISMVEGPLNSAVAKQMRDSHTSLSSIIADGIHITHLSAVGLSLILHPQSPHIPTIHANCRLITIFASPDSISDDSNNREAEAVEVAPHAVSAWFGGGIDLTPYYIFDDDVSHFHSCIKHVCDGHSKSYYPRFKKWCDEYFWNTHRNEARGVGGVFFDNLGESTFSSPTRMTEELDQAFSFVQDLLRAWPDTYLPLVERHLQTPHSAAEKAWQLLRRGRYVEFNLLHDRGTKFGLAGGSPRVESILASLPPQASWRYDHRPDKGSPEDALLVVLGQPREWAI